MSNKESHIARLKKILEDGQGSEPMSSNQEMSEKLNMQIRRVNNLLKAMLSGLTGTYVRQILDKRIRSQQYDSTRIKLSNRIIISQPYQDSGYIYIATSKYNNKPDQAIYNLQVDSFNPLLVELPYSETRALVGQLSALQTEEDMIELLAVIYSGSNYALEECVTQNRVSQQQPLP